MKKLILMLVCVAWIGNNAILLAANNNQHSCCTAKMTTTCKAHCAMSNSKVKDTEVVVFSQTPSYVIVLVRLFTLNGALAQTKKLYSLNLGHPNDTVPIPIYLQNHTFLI